MTTPLRASDPITQSKLEWLYRTMNRLYFDNELPAHLPLRLMSNDALYDTLVGPNKRFGEHATRMREKGRFSVPAAAFAMMWHREHGYPRRESAFIAINADLRPTVAGTVAVLAHEMTHALHSLRARHVDETKAYDDGGPLFFAEFDKRFPWEVAEIIKQPASYPEESEEAGRYLLDDIRRRLRPKDPNDDWSGPLD